MKFSESLRRFVPVSIKQRYRALRSVSLFMGYVLYDVARFMRVSSCFRISPSLFQEDVAIVRITHSIEKGLSLKAPRPGFGAVVVDQLCGMIKNRLIPGRPWNRACDEAINALSDYRELLISSGIAPKMVIQEVLTEAEGQGHKAQCSSVLSIDRGDIEKAVQIDAKAFFWSRHSIRNYCPGQMEESEILAAIDLARSSPSVCNRQSARVKLILNRGDNFDFLKLQNGNRGFGTDAQAVIIVTSDLRCFLDEIERKQAWIDGGMFAMTLVLGLHAAGFGTCCLNWSQTNTMDKTLRRALQLPDYETVIMLITVGLIPLTLKVARSERKPLDEILTAIQ